MSLVRTKLLVVDAMSIVFRHHFAVQMRPMQRPGDGRIVSGLNGLCRTIIKYAREIEPTHIVVCVDTPGGRGGRTAVFNEYKAHRPSVSDDLKWQLRQITDLVSALGVTVVPAPPGWEADDVIAALCARVERDKAQYAAHVAASCASAEAAGGPSEGSLSHSALALRAIEAHREGKLYLLGCISPDDEPLITQPHATDKLPTHSLPGRFLLMPPPPAAPAQLVAGAGGDAAGGVDEGLGFADTDDEGASSVVEPAAGKGKGKKASAKAKQASIVSAPPVSRVGAGSDGSFAWPWPKQWPFVTTPRPLPSPIAAVAAQDTAYHRGYTHSAPAHAPSAEAEAAVAAAAPAEVVGGVTVGTWDVLAAKGKGKSKGKGQGKGKAKQVADASAESAGNAPVAAAPSQMTRHRALLSLFQDDHGTAQSDGAHSHLSDSISWDDVAEVETHLPDESAGSSDPWSLRRARSPTSASSSRVHASPSTAAEAFASAEAAAEAASTSAADSGGTAVPTADVFSEPMRLYFSYLSHDPLTRLCGTVPTLPTLAAAARLVQRARAGARIAQQSKGAAAGSKGAAKRVPGWAQRWAGKTDREIVDEVVGAVLAYQAASAAFTSPSAPSTATTAVTVGTAGAGSSGVWGSRDPALPPHAGLPSDGTGALASNAPSLDIWDALGSLPLIDHTFVLSYDKDFAQLVSPHTTLLRPDASTAPGGRRTVPRSRAAAAAAAAAAGGGAGAGAAMMPWLTPALVETVYGVPPHGFDLYLALLGDRSDNVPGVKACGAVGASAVVAAYAPSLAPYSASAVDGSGSGSAIGNGQGVASPVAAIALGAGKALGLEPWQVATYLKDLFACEEGEVTAPWEAKGGKKAAGKGAKTENDAVVKPKGRRTKKAIAAEVAAALDTVSGASTVVPAGSSGGEWWETASVPAWPASKAVAKAILSQFREFVVSHVLVRLAGDESAGIVAADGLPNPRNLIYRGTDIERARRVLEDYGLFSAASQISTESKRHGRIQEAATEALLRARAAEEEEAEDEESD